MDAFALKDQQGDVRAWGCGHCGAVETPPSHRIKGFSPADIVKFSLESAAKCCRCRRCQGPKPKERAVYCEGCVPSPPPPPPEEPKTVPCPACGHSILENMKLCGACSSLTQSMLPADIHLVIRGRTKSPAKHLVVGPENLLTIPSELVALCGTTAKRGWSVPDEKLLGEPCTQCVVALQDLLSKRRRETQPEIGPESSIVESPAEATAPLELEVQQGPVKSEAPPQPELSEEPTKAASDAQLEFEQLQQLASVVATKFR